jgi:YHS domain-containing protein
MEAGAMRLLVAALVAVLLALPAAADGTTINVDAHGVAIDGYDPVAYFKPSGALHGKPEFRAEWQGATWYFVNADNRDAFLAEPEHYAPQYGGWCAYALSQGEYASDTDPREAFTVIDGKLYMNWSRQVKRNWERDALRYIDIADDNWPVVERQLLDGTARVSLHPE